MNRKILHTLLIAAAIAIGLSANAEMVLIEEAAEFERLTARVNEKGKGYVQLRACDYCATLQLKITGETKLVINGKSRPVTDLNNGSIRFGTAFYDAESMQITRIVGSRK